MIASFPSLRPAIHDPILDPYPNPIPKAAYPCLFHSVTPSPSWRRLGSNLGYHFRFDASENLAWMEWVRRCRVGCFAGAKPRRRELKVELDSGGEDVFDAAVMESSTKPDHLVIMVNGIIGSAEDWKFAAEQFVKKLPDQVFVHRSESNYAKLTFDGVDLMGQRLAEEVLAVIENRSWLRKISFVAHSLGGLIARYAIGRLYEQICEAESLDSTSETKNTKDGRIAGLEPMNFITFATPHLGSKGRRQFPILCGLPFLERRASQTAHLVAGRTGKHLFLVDNDEGKSPLLLRMATDSDDLKFISALSAFRRRVAYANVNYDYMVGWRTSSIRRQKELPTPKLLAMDSKYPHVVHVEQGNATHISYEPTKAPAVDPDTDLEEEMIKGLAQLSWERVDVSFHKSKQRYVAHNTIQVKTYWLNSDGKDVVFHMIDNFLL